MFLLEDRSILINDQDSFALFGQVMQAAKTFVSEKLMLALQV